MDSINTLRKKIDTIDDKIMQLLNERYDIAITIGQLKAQQDKQVFDSNRETNILDKTSKYSHSPQLINVYKTIMNESKSLQRK